jgi:hypothetical protein
MYLPTLSDLLDRLSIVQLKEIFLAEHRGAYRAERLAIMHDIDQILLDKSKDGFFFGAADIHAALMVMLTNRYIWENESKAREGGSEQDRLLRLTHSVNGVRNTAKNVIATHAGDRRDYKIDCFAAELVAEFGDWNIFV